MQAFTTSADQGMQKYSEDHHQLYCSISSNLTDSAQQKDKIYIIGSVLPGFKNNDDIYIKEQVIWCLLDKK
jgi:hypothetical protein